MWINEKQNLTGRTKSGQSSGSSGALLLISLVMKRFLMKGRREAEKADQVIKSRSTRQIIWCSINTTNMFVKTNKSWKLSWIRSFPMIQFLKILDDKMSENSDLWFMALDLLLHVLVLHHVMQFWNFYLVFLSVS